MSGGFGPDLVLTSASIVIVVNKLFNRLVDGSCGFYGLHKLAGQSPEVGIMCGGGGLRLGDICAVDGDRIPGGRIRSEPASK